MYELLALRAPYADIIEGEDGNEAMSWDQVTALTHKEGVDLRPTLPGDMDPDTAALICECWAPNQEFRPSFSVILFRLEMVCFVCRCSYRSLMVTYRPSHIDGASRQLSDRSGAQERISSLQSKTLQSIHNLGRQIHVSWSIPSMEAKCKRVRAHAAFSSPHRT